MYPVEISIIIVSWNVADLLDNCIQSIIENVCEHRYEIIVIDNHSVDHTLSMLQKKYPWVKVIYNSENVGYARANNQGFEIATGQFIFLLNPDTLVMVNALDYLSDALYENPTVGISGPKLIYPNGEVQISCARLLPTMFSVLFLDTLRFNKFPFIGNWFSRQFINAYDYDTCQTVEAVSGASMLIRRNVLNEIIGFGENFIHAGEDLDLCFRVLKAGWEIYYVCDASIIHLGGQSSSQAPLRTKVNVILSIQEYLNRCHGKLQGLIYKFIVFFIEVPITVAIGFGKLLLRIESIEEFKNRLVYIKKLWMWREIKA